MKVGVIGYGYWGPNIVRNLMSHPNVSGAVVADQRKERLSAFKKVYPSIATFSEGCDQCEGCRRYRDRNART